MKLNLGFRAAFAIALFIPVAHAANDLFMADGFNRLSGEDRLILKRHGALEEINRLASSANERQELAEIYLALPTSRRKAKSELGRLVTQLASIRNKWIAISRSSEENEIPAGPYRSSELTLSNTDTMIRQRRFELEFEASRNLKTISLLIYKLGVQQRSPTSIYSHIYAAVTSQAAALAALVIYFPNLKNWISYFSLGWIATLYYKPLIEFSPLMLQTRFTRILLDPQPPVIRYLRKLLKKHGLAAEFKPERITECVPLLLPASERKH